MRRVVCLAILILLMVNIFVRSEAGASFSTTVSVEPGSVVDHTLISGAGFSIDIVVSNVRKLWGYQFSLAYNPKVLRGVSVENGQFLGSAGGRVIVLRGEGFDNVGGKLKLFGACLFPKTMFPTGSGVLATVTFEVVGEGGSFMAFGPETGLSNEKGEWIIHGTEYLENGYFANAEAQADFAIPEESSSLRSGTNGSYVDQHYWNVITVTEAQKWALLTHDADAGAVPRDADIQPLLDAGFTLTSTTELDMSFLAMNCRDAPLNDTSFRQAIARLVNKDYIESLYGRLVEKLNYWLPPGQAKWTNLNATLPGFDPYEATQILDNANYVQGSTPNDDWDQSLPWSAQYMRKDPLTGTDLAPIRFVAPYDALEQIVVPVIMQGIKKAGIPTEAEYRTPVYLVQDIKKYLSHWMKPHPVPPTPKLEAEENQWDILHGLCLEFDTEPILYEIFKSDQAWNFWGINNTVLDYWCDKTRKTLDETEFKEAVYKIQELANELMPFVPMFVSHRLMAYSGVSGGRPGYIGIVNAPGNRRLSLGSPYGSLTQNQWIKMLGRRVTENVGEWENTNEWVISQSPNNLNPLWASEWYNWQVIDLLFDNLIERNPYYPDEPNWGKRPWAASVMPTEAEWKGPNGEKGMIIEFVLRGGLTWHDNMPITAEDCVFALWLIKNQSVAPYYSIGKAIHNIEQTGNYSFKVYYLQRYIFASEDISSVALLTPKHIWGKFIAGSDKQIGTSDDRQYHEWRGWEEPNGSLTELIGSGPFVYHSGGLVPGAFVRLDTNCQYFGGRICPGDVDLSGLVELPDVSKVIDAFGSSPGTPTWDPACDVAAAAQIINLDDFNTVLAHYGHNWGPGYEYPCT